MSAHVLFGRQRLQPLGHAGAQRRVRGRSNPPPPDPGIAERLNRPACRGADRDGPLGAAGQGVLAAGGFDSYFALHPLDALKERAALVFGDGRAAVPDLLGRGAALAPGPRGAVGLKAVSLEAIAGSAADASMSGRLLAGAGLDGTVARLDAAIVARGTRR